MIESNLLNNNASIIVFRLLLVKKKKNCLYNKYLWPLVFLDSHSKITEICPCPWHSKKESKS
jgi:hypothetical protein